MKEYIVYKGVYSFIIAQEHFHLAKLMLAFLDNFFIGIFSHEVIFFIYQLQSFFIKFKFDNPAFIVYRAGCSVFHRLSHIVNIDVVAEYFSGTSVSSGNRSAGKTYITRIGKTVPNNTGSAYNSFCDFLSGLIFCYFNLLGKSVLSSMSFISHNNYIPPF